MSTLHNAIEWRKNEENKFIISKNRGLEWQKVDIYIMENDNLRND